MTSTKALRHNREAPQRPFTSKVEFSLEKVKGLGIVSIKPSHMRWLYLFIQDLNQIPLLSSSIRATDSYALRRMSSGTKISGCS